MGWGTGHRTGFMCVLLVTGLTLPRVASDKTTFPGTEGCLFLYSKVADCYILGDIFAYLS